MILQPFPKVVRRFDVDSADDVLASRAGLPVEPIDKARYLREHPPRVVNERRRFLDRGRLAAEQRDSAPDLLGRVALEPKHVFERPEQVIADHGHPGDEPRHRIACWEAIADLEADDGHVARMAEPLPSWSRGSTNCTC